MRRAGQDARRRAPCRAFGVVGLVLAGALYLIAVRGQALLVDLSALSQRIFCF